MTPEFEAQVSKAIDEAVVFIGENNYTDGMGKFCAMLEQFLAELSQIRTKEEFLALLNQAGEIPPQTQMYFLALLQGIPQILQFIVSKELPKLAEELPPLPTGRKQALTLEQRTQVCDYVAHLHRQGTPIQISKQRAAQKYGVRLRSVERAWAKRAEACSERPKIPVEDLVAWMRRE